MKLLHFVVNEQLASCSRGCKNKVARQLQGVVMLQNTLKLCCIDSLRNDAVSVSQCVISDVCIQCSSQLLQPHTLSPPLLQSCMVCSLFPAAH